jgi:sulfite exporter TauE/SafE
MLFAVAGASLIGSLHCAGMCGPFVAFYAGSDVSSGGRRTLSHVAYHSGRLVTYALLGAVAGSIGAAIDLAGGALGVGRIAAVVAGLVMLAWGAVLLLQAGGVRLGRWLPRALVSRSECALRRLKEKPPVARALLLGLSSTLLPCGWLYAFVVTAAGTGSALTGAATMFAFWLGTVPLLLGLGALAQGIAGRVRRHLPVVSALLLVLLGLGTVVGRLDVGAFASPCCHHQAP